MRSQGGVVRILDWVVGVTPENLTVLIHDSALAIFSGKLLLAI